MKPDRIEMEPSWLRSFTDWPDPCSGAINYLGRLRLWQIKLVLADQEYANSVSAQVSLSRRGILEINTNTARSFRRRIPLHVPNQEVMRVKTGV
jgi:hypothetical protein